LGHHVVYDADDSDDVTWIWHGWWRRADG